MQIKKVQYTISEYADMIGVSKFKIYKMIESGFIECHRSRSGKMFIRL